MDLNNHSVRRGAKIALIGLTTAGLVMLSFSDQPGAFVAGVIIGCLATVIYPYASLGQTKAERHVVKTGTESRLVPPPRVDTVQWHSRHPKDLLPLPPKSGPGLTPPDISYPEVFDAEAPSPAKRRSKAKRGPRERLDPDGEAYGDLNWPPPDYAIEGRFLLFSYHNAAGEYTDRRVKNWRLSAREYGCFNAYCTLRKAQRTFRIDRVIMWGEG